jgi:LmbE family N-acetylglucosaminyl deacetylase
VVVIAPHPDDETLGVGGTLCTLAKLGSTIELVALTDGGASHPHSPSTSRAQLASMRAEERIQAWRELGLSNSKVTRLGLDDGTLSQTQDLAERLMPLVRGATYCLSPYREDGHPDHDAAGNAAAQACAACDVQLYEFPIWIWHWANASGDALPWSRARRVELERYAQRAKASALRAYHSQVAPLSAAPGDETALPKAVLEHFARDFEVLFV